MGLCRAHRPGVQRAGGRGTYQLEQVPLTTAGLGVIDLQPTAIAGLLRDAIAEGRDLFTLPDLRSGPATQIPGGI